MHAQECIIAPRSARLIDHLRALFLVRLIIEDTIELCKTNIKTHRAAISGSHHLCAASMLLIIDICQQAALKKLRSSESNLLSINEIHVFDGP
jgi:hypothetical protein